VGTLEVTHWIVTGAGGMLGRDLCDLLAAEEDVELAAYGRAQLDITRPGTLDADVVVNAAAWTDVDGAEAHEAEATLVNGTAVALLADACRASGARLIQLSTDYVFPGRATEPIPEDALTAPVNAYGRGKLVGERAAAGGYIVRTAWLYGAHGRNFVDTILRRAQTHEKLQVVNDQLGQPTWTRCLAAQIIQLGRAALQAQAEPGIYHGTASGSATWYDLAVAAFEDAGLDASRIEPVTSDAFPRPAPRPAYSVLGHDAWVATGVAPQPHWRDQLRDAFAAGVFAGAVK
jgi:dTDP-4-dehydrorhamnose reductase